MFKLSRRPTKKKLVVLMNPAMRSLTFSQSNPAVLYLPPLSAPFLPSF